MGIGLCIAGVSGWTGRALAEAVLDSPDFELRGAVARGAAGQDVGLLLGRGEQGTRVCATVDEALGEAEVLIDYTHPEAVKGHVMTALARGVHVVIGTSGLTAADDAEIDAAARGQGRGVVAAGNFSITAALLKHFAGLAARHVPHWEIVDYAHGSKPDAPSGTARELAEFLAEQAENRYEYDVDRTLGERSARGLRLGGAQVHSVRLPGHVLSFEALFGLPDERLSLRHDAGSGAGPYVSGTLLAASKARESVGLIRGMDTLLFGDSSDSSGKGGSE